jgi:fucose 4-O-acetylase-like acetyltransferase
MQLSDKLLDCFPFIKIIYFFYQLPEFLLISNLIRHFRKCSKSISWMMRRSSSLINSFTSALLYSRIYFFSRQHTNIGADSQTVDHRDCVTVECSAVE